MNNPADLDLTCGDFLKDNHHFYAHKARRKKIALISVEAANKTSADVRLMLGDSKLMAGEQSYSVEPSAIIIRKLSEFTWDFVLYTILDFQPLLAVVDGFVFLIGPLYNRRLKKQLLAISDSDMVVRPGECRKAILGFRGVSKGADQLKLFYHCGTGEKQQVQCSLR
jgi:hypothetical protein